MASERKFSISDPPKYADLIEIAEKISARLNDHTELVKFGLKLLDEETVKRVKRDCSDKSLRDLCLELLEKWQSSKDKPTCDDVVAAALRAINQRELAKMIEDAKKQSDTQARKRPTDKEQDETVSKKVKSTSESDESTNPEDIIGKYEGFTLQLTQILPMKDPIFLASLTAVGLFGKGNLKSEVKAKPTASEAAQHFLDEAISKNITVSKVDLKPLYKLLNVMEKFGGPAGNLAKDMKKAIPYSGE